MRRIFLLIALWLLFILATTVAFAFLHPTAGKVSPVLLLVLVFLAIAPIAFISLLGQSSRGATLVTTAAVLFNLGSLGVCLHYFSFYNSLLIYATVVMFVSYFVGVQYDCQRPQVIKVWLLVNLATVASLLLAVPDVNGVHLTMHRITVPTKVGLYPVHFASSRLSERSQHFHHARARQAERAIKFQLHSPVSSNISEAVNFLLKPTSPTGFAILSLELVNYLGFDARRVELFDSVRLGQIKTPDASLSSLINVKGDSLAIERIAKYIWLQVPINTTRDVRRESLASSKNLVRALFYWQIIWALCILLSPIQAGRTTWQTE